MAMFSESSASAVRGPVVCPSCKQEMLYNQEDNFFRCPGCKGEYWPNEPKMPCPGCGRAMKFNNVFGYHKCSSCGSEFWPPESKEADDDGEQKEDDPSTWKCSGRVYAGEFAGLKSNAVKGGSKSGGHRAKKKPKPCSFNNSYMLT